MRRELNDIMEFEHVIRVNPDGTIDPDPRKTHPFTPHAAESVVEADHDGQVSQDGEDAWAGRVRSEGWEPERGWTGQYGYRGAFMHAAEYVGGSLEDHIRETPGLWVVVVVSCLIGDPDPADADHDPDDCGTCADRDAAEEEPAGWAVLHMDDGPETDSYVVTLNPGEITSASVAQLKPMDLEKARKLAVAARTIPHTARIVRVTDLAVMPDTEPAAERIAYLRSRDCHGDREGTDGCESVNECPTCYGEAGEELARLTANYQDGPSGDR